ncbi:MAG: helix-turn-helix domain-containing protein [Gammaproteobacteria bacterium]|nr:helix-turn-helix domain-containing protein [Gammaproteobacteria bacterium]
MLLTKKQAAEEMACSPRTVQRIIDSGALRVIKVTESKKGERIHPDDLAAYIQGQRWQSGGTNQAGRSMSPAAGLASGLRELLELDTKPLRLRRRSASRSLETPSLTVVSNKGCNDT